MSSLVYPQDEESYSKQPNDRAFIGILGASFVMAQSWTTSMFQRNIVGRANALVAGWGNLGEKIRLFDQSDCNAILRSTSSDPHRRTTHK